MNRTPDWKNPAGNFAILSQESSREMAAVPVASAYMGAVAQETAANISKMGHKSIAKNLLGITNRFTDDVMSAVTTPVAEEAEIASSPVKPRTPGKGPKGPAPH
jgi:hypothetical protein